MDLESVTLICQSKLNWLRESTVSLLTRHLDQYYIVIFAVIVVWLMSSFLLLMFWEIRQVATKQETNESQKKETSVSVRDLFCLQPRIPSINI